MTGGRIAALVVGVILALLGSLFAFGGWAITNAESLTDPVSTVGHAIVINIDALTGDTELSPDERSELGDFELTFTVSSTQPVFIGTGESADVEQFVENVSRKVLDFNEDSITTELDGSDRPDPTDESFWIETFDGVTSAQVPLPMFAQSSQQMVIMNADGSAGVDIEFGFDFSSLPYVGTFAAVALGGGIVAVLFGLGLAAWAIITRNKGNETVADPLGWDN